MKKLTLPAVVLALVCLVLAQGIGIHTHADNDGLKAGLHGVHLHETDSHGQLHLDDTDVPVVEEPGTTWGKMMLAVIVGALLLLALLVPGARLHFSTVPFAKPRRWSRLRPPLRAPPLTH